MPEKKPELKNRTLRRELSVDVSKTDAESRVVEFSFSSEFPVERWFGKEILSHASGAADLSRMNAGANLLFNHDMDRYIGVVQKAWIGEDKRGYCEVRFSKNPDADQIFQDVQDGVLRNVSFGYMIDELVLSKQGKDGQDSEYTATRWVPYEVSVVSVPADPTIGIGRSAGQDDEALKALVERATAGSKEVIEEVKKNAVEPATKGRIMPDIDVKLERESAIKEERARVKAITALCDKHGFSDLARELIDGDKTVVDAREIVLEKVFASRGQKPVAEKAAELGMNEKEVRQYSFLKAIRAQMYPNEKKFQEEAAFEREVSESAQKLTGRAARGFLVPFDVLKSSKRDLTVGTSTAGGNLVATDLLAGSFIELLRNKSVLNQAGAQLLTGLVGNIAVPRATGAATAYWVGEGSAVTESAQAFDQVSMSPKTVGAFVDYSRKLMLQSSMDIESLVRSDLAMVIALEIDRVGLYGSGSSNQPLGVKNTSGINTKSISSAGAPTFAEMVDLETKVNTANADVAVMKYLANSAGVGSLKTTVKAGTFPVYVMENGEVNGYPVLRSNQIVTNDFWFGVWNQLILGFWSGLDILIDPYTGGTAGNVRVIAHQDMDVAVRHPTSFTYGS
jgi:HK97 family phage major capsid protein/HK97 family phage prohead protease